MDRPSVYFLEAKLLANTSHPIWYIIEHQKQPNGRLTLIGRHAFDSHDDANRWCAASAAAKRQIPSVGTTRPSALLVVSGDNPAVQR